MHRGVVFAPRRPSKVPRMHLELICWALVYVLGNAPRLVHCFGNFFASRPAARGAVRDSHRAPKKRVKKGAFSRVCIGELES